METSTLSCLSGMGTMDHGFINNWSMNFLDELNTLTSMGSVCNTTNDEQFVTDHHHHHQPVFSHKHYMEFSPNGAQDINRPIKQQKSSSWSASSSCSDPLSTPQAAVTSPNFHVLKPKEETNKSSFTVNFGPGIMAAASHGSYDHGNQNYVFKASQGAKRVSPNPRLAHAQDHIIAERKRREKLSQRFIAMSALLPGLKKMDKASVLGDAIKYIKQLQEKVTTLEEARKKSVETVVFVRKNRICANGDDFSSHDEPLPEIEAKICKKEVLIRVHCEKRKGIQEAAVAEIEKLPLSVISSCALSFGDSTLDITIIAKMEEHFSMKIKDLVMHLRSALKNFM